MKHLWLALILVIPLKTQALDLGAIVVAEQEAAHVVYTSSPSRSPSATIQAAYQAACDAYTKSAPWSESIDSALANAVLRAVQQTRAKARAKDRTAWYAEITAVAREATRSRSVRMSFLPPKCNVEAQAEAQERKQATQQAEQEAAELAREQERKRLAQQRQAEAQAQAKAAQEQKLKRKQKLEQKMANLLQERNRLRDHYKTGTKRMVWGSMFLAATGVSGAAVIGRKGPLEITTAMTIDFGLSAIILVSTGAAKKHNAARKLKHLQVELNTLQRLQVSGVF